MRKDILTSIASLMLLLPSTTVYGAYKTPNQMIKSHQTQTEVFSNTRSEFSVDKDTISRPDGFQHISRNSLAYVQGIKDQFLSKSFIETLRSCKRRARHRRSPTAVVAGIGLAIDLASYALDIYEMVHLTQPSEIEKLEKKVDSITSVVSNVFNKLQTIQTQIDNLYKLITLTYYQSIFIGDSSTIKSCYTDYSKFILDPFSDILQSRMNSCYSDARQSVRNVMTVSTVGSGVNNPFLNYTRTTEGCNGKELNYVWSYIFGIVTEGCISVIAAEQIIFGNTSFQRVADCNQYFDTLENVITSTYIECANQPCSDVESFIKSYSSGFTNSTTASDILVSLFPWYNITVIELTSVDKRGTTFGTLHISSMTLTVNSKHFMILWTPETMEYCIDSFNQSSTTGYNLFMLNIETKYVSNYYNGIRLHVVSGLTSQIYFTGYAENITRTSQMCDIVPTIATNTNKSNAYCIRSSTFLVAVVALLLFHC